MAQSVYLQFFLLFVLSIPIACIAWTVTHEEVFREPREYCIDRSKNCKSLFSRKFFYLFTCEYCFSHYVTILMIIITDYHLIFDDWRGYVIGGFSLVWIANVYISLYSRIRIDIKKEKTEIALEEKEIELKKSEHNPTP
ncbi:MAG: hypothetical protein ABIQ40_13185 [Bacteroidia bacterium]